MKQVNSNMAARRIKSDFNGICRKKEKKRRRERDLEINGKIEKMITKSSEKCNKKYEM